MKVLLFNTDIKISDIKNLILKKNKGTQKFFQDTYWSLTVVISNGTSGGTYVLKWSIKPHSERIKNIIIFNTTSKLFYKKSILSSTVINFLIKTSLSEMKLNEFRLINY